MQKTPRFKYISKDAHESTKRFELLTKFVEATTCISILANTTDVPKVNMITEMFQPQSIASWICSSVSNFRWNTLFTIGCANTKIFDIKDLMKGQQCHSEGILNNTTFFNFSFEKHLFC